MQEQPKGKTISIIEADRQYREQDRQRARDVTANDLMFDPFCRGNACGA